MDGHQQRKALTAAERALDALASGEPESARRAAARAADLDQIGAFATLEAAVGSAAAALEAGSAVDDAAWGAVAEAVGPGPLAAKVEQLRR